MIAYENSGFVNFISIVLKIFIVASLIHQIRSTGVMVPLPSEDFDPASDAEEIRDAMMGMGNDLGPIQDILTDRSCDQRRKIEDEYDEWYGGDIQDRIGKDFSGPLQRMLKDSFYCRTDILAAHLHRAVRGANTNQNALINILVLASESTKIKNELEASYQYNFGKSVWDAIKGNVSGDFENVLEEMVKRSRRDPEKKDATKAAEIAKQLNDEVNNWDDERKVLDATLNETPFEQLRLIFDEFRKVNTRDLMDVVKDKFDKDVRNTYVDLIFFATDPIGYYASCFMDSVDGPGTDEERIVRIILYRNEIDLADIKKEFQRRFGQVLEDKLGTDLSGGFEGLVRAFIAGNNNPATEEERKKKRKQRKDKQKEMKSKRAGRTPKGRGNGGGGGGGGGRSKGGTKG